MVAWVFALDDDNCNDNAYNDAFSKGQPQDLIIRQTCFLLKHRDKAFVLVSEFLHRVDFFPLSMCIRTNRCNVGGGLVVIQRRCSSLALVAHLDLQGEDDLMALLNKRRGHQLNEW